MAKKQKPDGPIIIKKYANRRLYDTSTSSYVTLDHLSDLVKKNADFEVRDAKTGEDLTRAVLTQIIYENETKGEGALPLNFLRQLIGFYGGGSQTFLPAWLDMSMNSFAESQERLRTVMGGANPMALFEDQARRNMAMFENTLKVFNPAMQTAETDVTLPDGDVGKPARNVAGANGATGANAEELSEAEQMLAKMHAQMAEMQKQLETLAKK
ncbi:MAG: polyhydroxyalkanoate synthesis repressor PhaR [Pseudomonadota bacterium]